MWHDPWAPESEVEGRKKEDRQAEGLGPGALGACLLRTDLHGMGVGGRKDIKVRPRGTWTSAYFPARPSRGLSGRTCLNTLRGSNSGVASGTAGQQD